MGQISVARAFRLLLSLVVAALLVAAVSGANEARTSFFASAQCSGPSLSAAFTGALRVTDVASYGCDDDWAYLWATVGNGEEAVGVTEVLHFDEFSGAWQVSSRLKVCKPGVMPNYIYRQGCFSN
jgi:hypothetical protein